MRRNRPLHQDPAKLAAWQTASRRRIAPQSAKRRSEASARSDVREAVFNRDGYRCVLDGLEGHRCGGPLTPHHIRKASQGGPYEPGNMISLCASANREVEDRPDWAWRLGLVIRNGESAHDAGMRRRTAGLPVDLTVRAP